MHVSVTPIDPLCARDKPPAARHPHEAVSRRQKYRQHLVDIHVWEVC